MSREYQPAFLPRFCLIAFAPRPMNAEEKMEWMYEQRRIRFANNPAARAQELKLERDRGSKRYATDIAYREKTLERMRKRYACDPVYREQRREYELLYHSDPANRSRRNRLQRNLRRAKRGRIFTSKLITLTAKIEQHQINEHQPD